MYSSLALFAILLQHPSIAGPVPSTTHLVESLDARYLYASSAEWQKTRTALLAVNPRDFTSVNHTLRELRDPDLRLVTAEQLKVIQQETEGHEAGIGVVDFALTNDPTSGEPQVVTALDGSAAFQAGLQPGDVISAIDGKPTTNLTHEEVMAGLRGSSGPVKLIVHHQSVTNTLSIPRRREDILSVGSEKLSSNNRTVGYIRVRLFTAESGQQVREAVHRLTDQGAERLIIDLRNNPGGYLDAMATAGSAFTHDALGWKVRRDNTREAITSSVAPLSSGRLVVLVNGGTASAAEALAAALRDTRKALLVGEPTFGRGQVQTYVALGGNGGLIVPAATLESPSGHRFNKRAGLRPDVAVVTTDERSDFALDKALELLRE